MNSKKAAIALGLILLLVYVDIYVVVTGIFKALGIQ